MRNIYSTVSGIVTSFARRYVTPCVGEIGDTPLESEFFDVDAQRGVQVTLMAHEVVFIPFAFLSLEPRRPTTRRLSEPSRKARRFERKVLEDGDDPAERSVVAAFVSTSHGHIVSAMQVCLYANMVFSRNW